MWSGTKWQLSLSGKPVETGSPSQLNSKYPEKNQLEALRSWCHRTGIIKSNPALSYPTSCLKSRLSGLIPGKGMRDVSSLWDTGKVEIQKCELWYFGVSPWIQSPTAPRGHPGTGELLGITAQGKLFAWSVIWTLPNSGAALTILCFDLPQTHAELPLSQHSLRFRSGSVGLMWSFHTPPVGLGLHESLMKNPFKIGTALPSNENRKGFKTSTRMRATETILSKTQPIVNVQIRKAKNRTVLISAQKYGEKIYLCWGRRKSDKFLFERFL